jgi:membrane protein
VNQFETYNQFYGSLGALIVLMLWLQINSFIILTGYELNASIIVNRAMRDLDDRD